MTDVFEFSEYKRENLLYSFVTLTPDEIAEKKNNFEKAEAEKSAQKAAAAAKKAEEQAAPKENKPSAEKPEDKKE